MCANDEAVFHACYRDQSPLPRKFCDHPLFERSDTGASDTGCQFARIDKYLFGLTSTGQDMFKCFFDAPEILLSKYHWDKETIDELMAGEGWAGERLSYADAMERIKKLADLIINYPDGSILFMFSRSKVDFNVEIYSTDELNFIEGFIIASIDSENYSEFLSIIVNEENIIEIEGDYGLNEAPDDNPWHILYDGYKLWFEGHEIYPN